MDLLDSFFPPEDAEKSKRVAYWCEKMCLDGKMVLSSEPVGTLTSSMLTNGLSFSETMLLKGNDPYLWRGHYMNIVDALVVMGLGKLAFPSADELLRRIQVLSQKNHYPAYSLVRVFVWLDTDTEELHYMIAQHRLGVMPYGVTSGKLFLSIYDGAMLSASPLSWIEMPRALETLAHRSALKEDCGGACLLNNEGKIVTTTLGNIYLITGNNIVGVGHSDGARRDPIEASMEEAAKGMGYSLKYMPGLPMSMVKKSRECFVCSTSDGIRVVDGCGDSRYEKVDGVVLSGKLKELFVF